MTATKRLLVPPLIGAVLLAVSACGSGETCFTDAAQLHDAVDGASSCELVETDTSTDDDLGISLSSFTCLSKALAISSWDVEGHVVTEGDVSPEQLEEAYGSEYASLVGDGFIVSWNVPLNDDEVPVARSFLEQVQGEIGGDLIEHEAAAEPSPEPTADAVWRDDSDDPRCDLVNAFNTVGDGLSAYATPTITAPSGLADVNQQEWEDHLREAGSEAEFDLSAWVVGWQASPEKALGAEQLNGAALVVNATNDGEEYATCSVFELTGGSVSDPDFESDSAAFGGGPWEVYEYSIQDDVPPYEPFYTADEESTQLVFEDPTRPGEYVAAEVLDPSDTASQGAFTAGMLRASGTLP